MKPLINKSGITIKELKEYIKDLPEVDGNGEDYEVWVINTDQVDTSDIAKSIMQLNEGDIIISAYEY